MKTSFVALVCLFGMAMPGMFALADNPPSASTPTPTPAPDSSWCAQHQQECQEHMQKRAQWCKQNQDKCRSLVQLDSDRVEAYCKQNPKDTRCEKLKQYMQNKNGASPKASPPPGT